MVESLFLIFQHLLPKRLVSDSIGWLTRLRGGWLTHRAIRVFVAAYGVDLSDAAIRTVEEFETFNAFFTRALQPGARPQPADPAGVACPADGTISEQGEIDGETLLQAKGVTYTLVDLFDGDETLANRFSGGSFQTVYLAPYNYHRVHMPLDGHAAHLRYIPGELFSVNAATARNLPRLFCRNERAVVVFERDDGCFAMIMVGALNVGSIELTLPRPIFVNRPRANLPGNRTTPLDREYFARGDEFGRFNMGSTVILLANSGLLEWRDDLRTGSKVRVGEVIGRRSVPMA